VRPPAGAVHARPFAQVARPAAAVALACQTPLGRQHAIAMRRGNVTLEVGFVAEQAESALDLPLDVWRGAGCGLRVDSVSAPGREQEEEEANDEESAHGVCRDRASPCLACRMRRKCEVRASRL